MQASGLIGVAQVAANPTGQVETAIFILKPEFGARYIEGSLLLSESCWYSQEIIIPFMGINSAASRGRQLTHGGFARKHLLNLLESTDILGLDEKK